MRQSEMLGKNHDRGDFLGGDPVRALTEKAMQGTNACAVFGAWSRRSPGTHLPQLLHIEDYKKLEASAASAGLCVAMPIA